MSTFTVTSKNRTAAKRLLNNWHDSRSVRTMTLVQLQERLQLAINQSLITVQGVQRALAPQSERNSYDAPTGDGNNESKSEKEEQSNDDDTTHDSESKSENENSESESEGDQSGEEGESEGEGDGEGEGEEQSEEQADSGEGEGEGEESESEQENESDDGSEGEEELTCDCCGKVCEQSELSAGEEGTPREGEALCEVCDAENTDDDSPIEHPMLATILKYVRAGLNVALVGPAGTGKSYMARQLADMTGRDFYVNGAMLSKYDLVGYNDAAGTYHGTPAFEAFTNGGLHCFDELDASAPDAVVAFNGMTDDQGLFAFPCGQKEKHSDYIAIACMNTFGNGATANYVGRYKQDAAAMDRFTTVYIDYDAKVENRIGSKDIVARVREVRQACETLGIQHICSYRMIDKATKARAQKATKAEIDRDIIFARLDKPTVKQIKNLMLATRKENNS